MARLFTQNNYDGSFSTVYQGDDGSFQELYRGDQQTAEQKANDLAPLYGLTPNQQPILPPSPTQTPGQPVANQPPVANPNLPMPNSPDWQALWDALTQSNQQQFDWQKQQALNQMAEQKRQFDLAQQMSGNQLLTSLAQSLLSGATSLRGPENWLSYANYTNGGKNLFDLMKGSTPAPMWGATGNSRAVNINDILGALGLQQPAQSSKGLAVAPAGQLPRAGSSDIISILGGNYSGANNNQQQYQAPNPWQINPAVWDSMSDTAKKMAIATAEAGNTPSGAWTATDFQNQINAARPKGQAPTRVRNIWQNPMGLF